MKTLSIVIITALFNLCHLNLTAQDKIPLNQPDYNKARLFEDIPQKIRLKVTELESLFDIPVGSAVTAKFSKDFYLQGPVVSRSVTSSLKSVVIRAANRKGAVFTFTRIQKQDGSVLYRGRILSKENSDAFELALENGEYILQKKNYHELVAE